MKTLKVIRGENRYGRTWNEVYLNGAHMAEVFSVTTLQLADGRFHYSIVPMADTAILTGIVDEVVIEDRLT